MNITEVLLYAALGVWFSIAIPVIMVRWKTRNEKPWVVTLMELKPMHPDSK